MKKKCQQCRGRGGWYKTTGRFEMFVSCIHCKGKGVWWTNQRPQRTKGKS